MANKQTARALRQSGLSIKKIAAQLNIAVGTAFKWVQDIPLTEEQRKNLLRRPLLKHVNAASRLRVIAAKERQKKEQAVGRQMAESDRTFGLLCMLYWGEGSKGGNTFCVANCDPAMIRLVFNWLCNKGYIDNIRFAVTYHTENGISESNIKKWWQEQVPGLADRHFRKFTIKNTKNIKTRKVGKIPYGTASIRVHRISLLNQTIGGIQYFRSNGI